MHRAPNAVWGAVIRQKVINQLEDLSSLRLIQYTGSLSWYDVLLCKIPQKISPVKAIFNHAVPKQKVLPPVVVRGSRMYALKLLIPYRIFPFGV